MTQDLNMQASKKPLQPFVEISGNGPALVLIHGWGLHGGIWETVVPELSQHFTVYNLDLPGFGRSPLHNKDYDLDYLVQSVAGIVPQDAIVLGWSLGGMVATQLALEHPDKVQRLVTVASNPRFVANESWPHAMQPELLESFIQYLEEDFEATLIRFLGIQTMGSATQKEDIKRLKDAVFLHGQPARKALRGGLQILHDADLVPRLAELKMPMLRLYGRLDSLVPKPVADQVGERIPGSHQIIYRKSAHAPFLSAADDFVSDILAFAKAEGSDYSQPQESTGGH